MEIRDGTRRFPTAAGMATTASMIAGLAVTPVDTRTLTEWLEREGVALPEGFHALVGVVEVPEDPDAAPKGTWFDHRGTSADREGWWPASTVKVIVAVAALERMRRWRFTPAARITVHHDDGDVDSTLEEMVRKAIVDSDNEAFDHLAALRGGDDLNRWLRRKGFRDTVLLRGYSGRLRDPETGRGTLRLSPAITIREEERAVRLPRREGRLRAGCPDGGNCTTLRDLTAGLLRVVLHEHLPRRERFDLGPAEVTLLRDALSAPRERGLGIVQGIRAAFAPRKITVWHKPGFALQWFSDHVVVRWLEDPSPGRHFVIAMAGHGGRDVLDAVARKVGEFLVTRYLRNSKESSTSVPSPE